MYATNVRFAGWLTGSFCSKTQSSHFAPREVLGGHCAPSPAIGRVWISRRMADISQKAGNDEGGGCPRRSPGTRGRAPCHPGDPQMRVPAPTGVYVRATAPPPPG